MLKEQIALLLLCLPTYAQPDSLGTQGWLPKGGYGFIEVHREFGRLGHSNNLVRASYMADMSIAGSIPLYRSSVWEVAMFSRMQIVMGRVKDERLTIPAFSGVLDISASYKINQWLSVVGGAYHQSTHVNREEMVITTPQDLLDASATKLNVEDLNLYYFGVRMQFRNHGHGSISGEIKTGLQPIKPVYYLVARGDRIFNSGSYPHYDRIYFYGGYLAWDFAPGNRATLEAQGEQGESGRVLLEARYSTGLSTNPNLDKFQIGVSAHAGMNDNEIVVTRHRGLDKKRLAAFLRLTF